MKQSKKFVTCEEMKTIERLADEGGLSYYDMMENAGKYAANFILKTVDHHKSDVAVMVFCGKGNNGGDGLVVARLLRNAGCKVTVLLVDGEPRTPDAITNYKLLNDMDISLDGINGDASIIVDGIYGTGFRGKLNGDGLSAVNFINSYKTATDATVFALDIPSGIGGNITSEEELNKNSVKADYTITFHAMKPVHIQDFAQVYCGKIVVADIGIRL